MVTVSPAPRDGDWVLRIALIASLLVHAMVVLIGLISYDTIVHVLSPATQAPPASQNEIVQVATVFQIERQAPQVSAPHAFHESAKSHVSNPAHFGFVPSKAPALQQNAAALAFAQALARHQNITQHALETTRDPSKVPEKFKLSMKGLRAKLTRGQGIYYPTRGWTQDGEDYYDASYEFIYPSGTDEKGVVPWPIHFDPAADPFFSSDPEALSKTPLPGPPPGFTPPGISDERCARISPRCTSKIRTASEASRT